MGILATIKNMKSKDIFQRLEQIRIDYTNGDEKLLSMLEKPLLKRELIKRGKHV